MYSQADDDSCSSLTNGFLGIRSSSPTVTSTILIASGSPTTKPSHFNFIRDALKSGWDAMSSSSPRKYSRKDDSPSLMSFHPDIEVVLDIKRANAAWNEWYEDEVCDSKSCLFSYSSSSGKSTPTSQPSDPLSNATTLSSHNRHVHHNHNRNPCSSRVKFSHDLEDVKIVEDDEDIRDSRMGCWHYNAQRFQSRVKNLGELLTPFFSPEHRSKVYDQLYPNRDEASEASRDMSCNEIHTNQEPTTAS